MSRLQISLRTALLVITYVAGWLVAWEYGNKKTGPVELVSIFFVIALPAWCIGAILRQHLAGILCGTASGATMVAIIVFASP